MKNRHPAGEGVLRLPVGELGAILPEGDPVREAAQAGDQDVSDRGHIVQTSHWRPSWDAS
jgi:hypothetical protein